jgi:hypothetical protein
VKNLDGRDPRWAFFFAEGKDPHSLAYRMTGGAQSISEDFSQVLGRLAWEFQTTGNAASSRIDEANRWLILHSKASSHRQTPGDPLEIWTSPNGVILFSKPLEPLPPGVFKLTYSIEDNLFYVDGVSEPNLTMKAALAKRNLSYVRERWTTDLDKLMEEWGLLKKELQDFLAGNEEVRRALRTKYYAVYHAEVSKIPLLTEANGFYELDRSANQEIAAVANVIIEKHLRISIQAMSQKIEARIHSLISNPHPR